MMRRMQKVNARTRELEKEKEYKDLHIIVKIPVAWVNESEIKLSYTEFYKLFGNNPKLYNCIHSLKTISERISDRRTITQKIDVLLEKRVPYDNKIKELRTELWEYETALSDFKELNSLKITKEKIPFDHIESEYVILKREIEAVESNIKPINDEILKLEAEFNNSDLSKLRL